MNSEVTAYISEQPAAQQQILQYLRRLIHEAIPQVSEQIKWGRPIFRTTADFAYLKTSKSYITLGFFDAGTLGEHPNLEGTGKNMRHIKIRQISDLDRDLLKTWLTTVTFHKNQIS